MRRNERLVAGYLDRLERESAELAGVHGGKLDTVYLGGGTPSMLEDAELARIVRILEADWGFPGSLETTLEADPLTFDERRLELFRELGFTRLSIGLQSTADATLAFLGRKHDGAEGLAAVRMALEAGFDVSADLITAVPGQDTERDLHTLASTGVNHVSVYGLIVEPFTPFALRGVRVDDDKAADDFALASEVLASYGLLRYEVSNHARPGAESRHNRTYWHGGWYLALGPSAASFLPHDEGVGIRRTNAPIRTWLLGAPGEAQVVGAVEFTLEMLMTGLRTREGADLGRLVRLGGSDPRTLLAAPLERMVAGGLLELGGDTLRATPEGLAVLNGVLREFFAAAEGLR